jgi:signal peptidase I
MIFSSKELMPIIQEALQRGQLVRITVTGYSMMPFIYDGDEVELMQVCIPKKGDIVLVQFSEERYVMHRIVRIKGNIFFIRGDAQLYSEGPFSFNTILGKVHKSFHNSQTRLHNHGIWHIAGLLWIHTYKITPYVRYIIRFPRTCASRAFRLALGVDFRDYLQKKGR